MFMSVLSLAISVVLSFINKTAVCNDITQRFGSVEPADFHFSVMRLRTNMFFFSCLQVFFIFHELNCSCRALQGHDTIV
jgi:hypothetical protein